MFCLQYFACTVSSIWYLYNMCTLTSTRSTVCVLLSCLFVCLFVFPEFPPHTQRFKKRASCSTLGTRKYLSDLLTPKSALQSFCVCSSDEDEEEEELHGKLEEDRFLFSVENDSAACDVLDLREVLSVFTTQNGSVIAQLCSSSYGRSS